MQSNVCPSNLALAPSSGCYGIVLVARWDDMGLCLLLADSRRALTVNMQIAA